jgi:hypothetical protein
LLAFFFLIKGINIKQQVCNFLTKEIKGKKPDRANPNQLSTTETILK